MLLRRTRAVGRGHGCTQRQPCSGALARVHGPRVRATCTPSGHRRGGCIVPSSRGVCTSATSREYGGDPRRRRGTSEIRRTLVATDLERFVSAPGRDDLIKKVRRGDRRVGRHVHLLPVHLGHRPDHGQGRARRALGVDGAQGLPARLRRDRQPLRRPARRVHRLRPRGRRARRPARAGDVPGAAVGHEGRARVVHLLPRPRGSRGRRLVPHGRLPQQPQADPGRSSPRRPACTCAPASSPR